MSAAAAVVVLQLGLAMYYWFPDPSVATFVAPTWELFAILAVLGAIGRVDRAAPRAVVRVALIAVALAFTVLGLAEGIARREFGYDAELALNIKYVPSLIHTIYRSETLAWFVLEAIGAVLAVALAIAALGMSIARLERVARDVRARRWLGGGLVAYALGAGLTVGVAGPLTAVAAAELDLALNEEARLAEEGAVLEREAAQAERPTLTIGSFRPSILIFVVESYGNNLLLDPKFSDFHPYLDDELAGLRTSGYTARSRYFDSPVFGGSSWIADASFLCGVRIEGPKRFAGLFHSNVRCLPAILREAGYHTVLAASNTTWLDHDFLDRFPFEALYVSDSFGYKGPTFSFSNIPDQYVIDVIDRREVGVARAEPLFAFYILSSSHFPWRLIPPYVSDWRQLGDGSIFNRLEPTLFKGNSAHSSKHFAKAYHQSVRYSLSTIFDYLASLPTDRAPLIVVLGDHQPRKPLADRETDPWWVPVHVLSRDPAIVERFAQLGYDRGLVPSPRGRVVGLERFLDDLAVAFGEPAAPPSLTAPVPRGPSR